MTNQEMQLGAEIYRQHTEIAQLKDERDALLKDAERLNWMHKNRVAVIPEFEGGWHAVGYENHLDDGVPSSEEVGLSVGLTLRDAIDAAMAFSSKGGK